MAAVPVVKWIRRLGDALTVAGGLAVVLMMAHIVVDVAKKYLLNDPIDGTTEVVAAYYMVASVFLPLAYVTYTEGQLVVELFTGRMSGRPLSLLLAFTGSATLAYVLFVAWCTAEEAALRTRDGEAWETSVDLLVVWPSRWLLPVGLAAMALVVLVETARHLRDGVGRDRVPPPGV